MLFNSVDFIVFFTVVFSVYWLIPAERIKVQNIWILVASYFFYGWWDWRFLILIFISTFSDYVLGSLMSKTNQKSKKNWLLFFSLVSNIGLLAVFKYLNFFLESFIGAFSIFGYTFSIERLYIILPVGISFYTFQTLSYTIDIYRGKIPPAKDFTTFAAFVSFFPQLVAGPIERASNLLPQFYKKRTFNYTLAKDGLRQILWGLFKKMIIADSAAVYVNEIFSNSADYNGSTLVIGAVLFAFQIYCDFSGYSDIAIGVAKLFGFRLMDNFAFPYFSRDIAEFWRRWHISLSTWFRDYLYIPLGGSRHGKWLSIRNIFIVFIVSGFWHGANWTFIVWGLIHAMMYLPLFIFGSNRKNLDQVGNGSLFPSLSDVRNIMLTFSLTTLGWIFFRAESITHAFEILDQIFSVSIFQIPEIRPYYLIGVIILFVVVEWVGREGKFAIQDMFINWPRTLRWGVYYVIIWSILSVSQPEQDFIYFQF